MKTTDNNQKKQLTELSDEELKQVTGGASIDCSLPENKDKFQCHVKFEYQFEHQFEAQFEALGPDPLDF